MKKITIGKKGFSLIELLATILLISLVLGGGITIVTNTIKKSEEKSQVLALNNIKKTANTYVEEYANDIAWIDDKDNNNNKFSCVSIDSLINKGYISNKDISSKYQDKIPKSRYIIVTRNQNKNIISQEFDNKGKCSNNIQKIEIPTAKDYCNTIYYNGNEQTLIKPYNNTYFAIEQIKGTEAGNYKATAKLKDSIEGEQTYVWSDDTTSDKTFTCTIKKQTPDFILSSNGEEGTDLSNATINLKSNVPGTVKIKSSNKAIASASFNTDNNIQKDISKETTIKKYATSKNTIYITFTLTPSESKNYTQATATYTIGKITKKTVNIPVCKNNNNIYHNFSYQNLIENNSGYTLINNIQKEVGKYKITAKLNYGYQWNDNSKEDKEIECEIKKSKFLLRYKDNGGFGCESQTKDIYYKQAYGSLCKPSKTGYSFEGWYENAQGTGNQITDTTIVNQLSDKTLYAKWEKLTFDIDTNPVIDGNQHNSGLDGFTYNVYVDNNPTATNKKDWWQKVEYGQVLRLEPNNVAGYTGETVTKTITDGTAVSGPKWTSNTFTATMNLNGGTSYGNTPSPWTAKYGHSYNIDNYIPSRTGYTFTGWYSAASGGNKFSGTWTWTAGNFTFYAHWRPNVCTITFSPNGGTFNSHSKDLKKELEYTDNAWDLRNAKGGYYNATNSSHYHLVTAKEWINGSTTYNQDTKYTPTQLCPNLASKDQNVTLRVNWSAKWYLCRNGYTCLNSIPDWNDCTYNASKITSDNNIRGYTITGESGKYFTTTIEVSKKDKKVYIWKGCLRESAAKATADCASTCVG